MFRVAGKERASGERVGASRARRGIVAAAVAAALLAAPGLAHAATCVVVDEARDGLAPEERSAAQTLLEDTLRHNQVPVAREGCTETWTLYHVRLGSNVTVVVRSPRGERRETVQKIEDLPAMYDQMVRAVLLRAAATNDSEAVTRKNVSESQVRTRRVAADAFWYGRLGYGVTPAGGLHGGPAFGLGRRWELDRIGIDVSVLNLIVYQDNDGYEGVGGSWIKLGVNYFLDAQANHTPYFGAGLSWGGNGVTTEDYDDTGSGLQGELVAGYEMFRASTLRLFFEADATLPMYRNLRRTYNEAGTTDREYRYAPMFTLSLGVGWGRAAR